MDSVRSHFWSVTVVAVVAAVYILSVASAAATAFSSDPVYRKESGVYFECAVRWDASRLMSIAQSAALEQTPVTFFVTADYCGTKGDTIKELVEMGHAVGLLLECERGHFRSEIERGKRAFAALGLPLKHIMAGDDGDASALCDAAKSYDVTTVSCTFEVKNNTTKGEKLVERVREDAFSGAIIRLEPTMVVDGVLLDIIDAVREKGLAPQALN